MAMQPLMQPINIHHFELQMQPFVQPRMVPGRVREDLSIAHNWDYLRIQVPVMGSSGGALRVEEWLIPSWPEDQYESVKRAVAEVYFVKHGGRPWTTCFHLEEEKWETCFHLELWPHRYLSSVRKDALQYVWNDKRKGWPRGGVVDYNRLITVVYDWGPNIDWTAGWAVWPPARILAPSQPRM